jgi:23S rRNA pseudouridine1911/1915/1917 synthase
MIASAESVITVNGKRVKKSRIAAEGDLIEFTFFPPPPARLQPQSIPLRVIYEDKRVVVVNKEQGMVVHPAAGNPDGTLVNALLHHTRIEGADGKHLRPGIVHRLDKDTSGVIIAAKDQQAHEYLAAQFKNRKTEKVYIALVKGMPPLREGNIAGRIVRDPGNRKLFTVTADERQGRDASTVYRVLKTFRPQSRTAVSLVRLSPRTGRTHQLRVHLQSIGCPIIGDPLYSRKDRGFPEAGLMLHALSLSIRLPGSEAERRFVAPLPARFREFVKVLDPPRDGGA